MEQGIQSVSLERHVRFDDRHPVAVQLNTTLPGQMLLIGLRTGQSLREHHVDTPIVIQVLRGEGTITAGSATCPATPGTLLPLAAGVAHSVAAETDLALLVYRTAVVEAEPVTQDAATPVAETGALTLDVRHLSPRDRHARIFATFDALQPGEALRLINDHDPKPLKYQFMAEHTGEVCWEPEQEGPDTWIIRISRVAATAEGV